MTINLKMTLNEFCAAQFIVVTIVITLGLSGYLFTYLTGVNNLLGFLRLLNVSSEQSIPTYVSAINLLLASILILVIYGYESANEKNGAGYWLFLSILFLYLSVDESASIHENFGGIPAYLVREQLISPIFYSYTWIAFGVFFTLAVSILLFPFLKKLPADTRRYFLIAGCVFVTGAIGVEYFGHRMLEIGVIQSPADIANLARRILEEGLEMYGVAIFNCALYREILRGKIGVLIRSY